MNDLEHARMMLVMARKDVKAIEGMKDVETFSDEIFGFHAQQAVEKALKAWLSLAGVAYPKIHDLEELFALLDEHGEPVPERFHFLVDLTDFAVQFRYEAFEDFDEKLDRVEVIRQVAELVDHVEVLIKDMEAGG